MRPEWLKCEGCLFLTDPDKGSGVCRFDRDWASMRLEDFCASWTCRRCLQPWRYPNQDNIVYDKHFNCAEQGVPPKP